MNIRDSISNIPPADTWEPQEEDIIFSNAKGIIAAPVSKSLNIIDEKGILDYFIMSSKKCYNSQVMRDHICLYLNYFEKYYDPDHELQVIMYRIKYMIDTTPLYSVENFMYDIRAYLLCSSLKSKVQAMVNDNYSLDLQYRNIPENLQYKNEHAMTMLIMSIFMNFVIPLITHFADTNKVDGIDEFILYVFDPILNMYPGIDIYSKIYETAYSNVSKSETKNAPIWAKQDIRGKDSVTHSYDSVNNIILNIMPKYVFNQSIISLNFTSILKSTSCQILDIEYEYNYISLSSSKRDESESSSEFDKSVPYSGDIIRKPYLYAGRAI